jgi:hypothetical protein
MRVRFVIVLGLIVAVLAPIRLSAWGMDVHRLITARALTGMPAGLKPFVAERSAFVVEHSADPDLWRIVGLKGDRGDEDPNHFLDIDGLDEPRPFTNVPREWDAYVARYGVERANKNGRLPWRTEEIYRLLVARFQDVAKGTAPYAADNAAYLSAVLAHYVEDAHQPFHAVSSYDGQATNQRGIHARFETEVVLRYRETLTLSPIAVQPIPNIKTFVFDRVIEGEGLVTSVLAADRSASGGRGVYDDAYYAAFFKGVRPILERRLSEAASAVASAITAAWTEAGSPAMPVKKTPPTQSAQSRGRR